MKIYTYKGISKIKIILSQGIGIVGIVLLVGKEGMKDVTLPEVILARVRLMTTNSIWYLHPGKQSDRHN